MRRRMTSAALALDGDTFVAGLYRITATPTGGTAHAVTFRVGRRSTR
jgi:hypothetical protein